MVGKYAFFSKFVVEDLSMQMNYPYGILYLTENQINNIVKITNNKIDECIKGIENADFTINPKKINGKNIGCNYCNFKDICYMTNRDIRELEDIKDLDYLN